MKEVDVSSLEHTSCVVNTMWCLRRNIDGWRYNGKDKRGHRDHTAEVVPASGYGRPKQEKR